MTVAHLGGDGAHTVVHAMTAAVHADDHPALRGGTIQKMRLLPSPTRSFVLWPPRSKAMGLSTKKISVNGKGATLDTLS